MPGMGQEHAQQASCNLAATQATATEREPRQDSQPAQLLVPELYRFCVGGREIVYRS